MGIIGDRQVPRRTAILVIALFLTIVVAVAMRRLEQVGTSGPSGGVAAVVAPSLSRLPLIRIALSDEDRRHFLDIYNRFEDAADPDGKAYYLRNNQWRLSMLERGGARYPIKIKSHGRNPYRHHIHGNISYALKMRNGGELHHAHRFSLIVYPRVFMNSDVLRGIAGELGVIADRVFPVEVDLGTGTPVRYFFEYRLNNGYMDDIGRPSLVSYGKRIIGKSPVISHLGPNDSAAAKLAALENALPASLAEEDLPAKMQTAMCERYLELNRAIVEGDPRRIARFFDERYLAAFEAIRLLTGTDGHGFTAGNNWMFYDTASGLFYPVYHRDHFAHPLSERKRLEKMPYENLRYPLWELLSRNDEVRQAKFQVLKRAMDSKLPERAETMLMHLMRSPYPRMGMVSFMAMNAAVIRERLLDVMPTAWWAEKGGQLLLTVRPSSLAALSVERLVLKGRVASQPHRVRVAVLSHDSGNGWQEHQSLSGGRTREVPGVEGTLDLTDLVADVAMSDAIDKEMQRVDRDYHFRISIDGAGKLPSDVMPDLLLRHSLRNDAIPLTPLEKLATPSREMARAAFHRITPTPTMAERLRDLTPDLLLSLDEQGRAHLSRGTYRLTEDLLLPKGVDLVIEAGVTLRMGAGVSLRVLGGLRIQGTEEEPVFVGAADPDRPFGTVAAVGDDTTVCDIRHLRIEDGNEDFIEGAHLSGSLSLYHHAKVRVSSSVVRNGRADDGLNIKYAEVVIENSVFENNYADQVDVDVAHGVIEGNRFEIHRKGSDNGDGLDVSFSDVLVADNLFSGLTDKGLSVGEKSHILVKDNRFLRNRLAVAVKGSSRAVLDGNVWNENGMVIFAYKKQKVFSGGEVFVVQKAGAAMPDGVFADHHSQVYRLERTVNAFTAETPTPPDAKPIRVTYRRFVPPPTPLTSNRGSAQSGWK